MKYGDEVHPSHGDREAAQNPGHLRLALVRSPTLSPLRQPQRPPARQLVHGWLEVPYGRGAGCCDSDDRGEPENAAISNRTIGGETSGVWGRGQPQNSSSLIKGH